MSRNGSKYNRKSRFLHPEPDPIPAKPHFAPTTQSPTIQGSPCNYRVFASLSSFRQYPSLRTRAR
jgi:hypothetical protein